MSLRIRLHVGAQSLQSCLILWDPMNCSPPGSSVHGILQARILEWVAIRSSRGSSWPRDWTHISWVSCIVGKLFTHWATWEASVQFSRSVVSNSLRPHESQHARPLCPSPTPGVHSDSCPSSQRCHPAYYRIKKSDIGHRNQLNRNRSRKYGASTGQDWKQLTYSNFVNMK